MAGGDPLAAAIARHRAGDLDAAIANYRDIIDATPDRAEAWHLLGVAVHQKGDPALGRSLIETAIQLDGTRPDYHSNLAQVLRTLGEDAGAEAALRTALAIAPNHGKALANLASVLRARGAFADAVTAAERAVAAAPNDVDAHINRGNALKDIQRVDEAVSAYERAIELSPDSALAHWNLSLALLALGDYERGFAEMQWRWRWSGFPAKPRVYDAPLWKGERGAGGTLFLYPEQGLGDTIQLVRLAPLTAARGWRVVLEAPAQLALLLSVGLADQVLTAPPAECDAHAPLGDLPHLLGVRRDAVPACIPYLVTEPGLEARMRALSTGGGRLRVGLNWTGNPASPVERFRGLPVDALAPLAGLRDIDWVCLQRGPGGATLPRPPGLAMIETGEGPLAETAALMQTLDVVVTTDTAVAHLAGALGRPGYVLLHHAPDWRWGLTGTSTPWYPALRLFRQVEPGDWGPPIAAVAEALAARV